MKIFIQEHLKAIIISLVAVICVTGTGIGILLYNSGKVDEPEVQEEASVATATDSALVGEAIEDKDEVLEADSEKVEEKDEDKKKEDKKDTQDVKKESSKNKDSSKESKTTDSDKKTTTKTTEAATSKTSTDNTTKTTESTKKNSDSSSGSGSSSSSSSSSASSKTSESGSSTGSGSKGSDSGSGSGSSSGSSESTTCSHTWVWATKTVHHEAVTTQEPVYNDEYDYPVYRDVVQCLSCGKQYNTVDELVSNDEHRHWTTVQVVDHYEHHDPEIIDYITTTVSEAYDETVNDYQYCSKCGARK